MDVIEQRHSVERQEEGQAWRRRLIRRAAHSQETQASRTSRDYDARLSAHGHETQTRMQTVARRAGSIRGRIGLIPVVVEERRDQDGLMRRRCGSVVRSLNDESGCGPAGDFMKRRRRECRHPAGSGSHRRPNVSDGRTRRRHGGETETLVCSSKRRRSAQTRRHTMPRSVWTEQ